MLCPICREEFLEEVDLQVRNGMKANFRYRNGVAIVGSNLVCCSVECAEIAVVSGRVTLERLFADEAG